MDIFLFIIPLAIMLTVLYSIKRRYKIDSEEGVPHGTQAKDLQIKRIQRHAKKNRSKQV